MTLLHLKKKGNAKLLLQIEVDEKKPCVALEYGLGTPGMSHVEVLVKIILDSTYGTVLALAIGIHCKVDQSKQ